MTGIKRQILVSVGCVALLAGCANLPAKDKAEEPSLHESLLTLDSHLDTPALLVAPGFDITQKHNPSTDYSQVDLPRMVEGGLDGGFWVIYTPQGELNQEAYQVTRDTAILSAKAIHEMVAAHPDDFALATKPEDAAEIAASGKRVVYLSIENAYPLGEDLSLLETFYKLGVRMVGPVHFANNQFADSSTSPDGPKWNGLSPLGKELVQEANRLGMVLDASHASDDVFDQLIELSATPIVLSHSGADAVYDHPRNIDDDRLRKLAASGGVIQVNAYGAYLTKLENDPERSKKLSPLFAEMRQAGEMSEADYQAFLAKRREVDHEHPPVFADLEDFMAHLLHILNVVGPDHVGLGADWDGGGGVEGMMDVASYHLVTDRLLAEGYSREDLEKIWSGNVLRLLAQAEAYATLAAQDN